MQSLGSLPQNILVFRALKLGDMLCSIPALRALKRHFPDVRITLLTLPSMEDLILRYREYVDEVLPFPGFPGMPETSFDPVETVNFLSLLQERKFDLAIQMHGSGEISNPFISLLNAKKVIGYYREGNYCPDPLYFRAWNENMSEIHRCLTLLEVLGVHTDNENLEFPLGEEDFRPLFDLDLRPKSYVCLHPGASTVSKRWPPGSFARVGDYMANLGFKVVFTGSPQDSGLVDEIQHKMKNESIDTARMGLPLGPLAALIKGSAGIICNDSAVSHLASALEVLSIVIFTETDPVRWAPLNKDLHYVLRRPGIEDVLISINHRLLAGNNYGPEVFL